MSQSRRHFGNEVKAQVVRRHLAGKEPVSQLAEEFGVQPSQIHTWVNLVLAQAEQAFERSAGWSWGRASSINGNSVMEKSTNTTDRSRAIIGVEDWERAAILDYHDRHPGCAQFPWQ